MRAKITVDHLERTALVYVRQSMPGQVRDHTESRHRQYGLVDVARELGFHRVETIDDDLGVSGSGFADRPGFQGLLTTVCAGTAGAVLALEASRLARNDRDWSQLVPAKKRTVVPNQAPQVRSANRSHPAPDYVNVRR